MVSFIKKFVFLSLPVVFLILLVNYFGDAAKLFNSEYEKKMASILLNGKYVTNISNYDERLFQKEVISKMRKCPEVIVLGSSRSMLINSKLYPNHSFFNSSVSGASIEDLIAIYQIYKNYTGVPQKILICIDPWTFNENNGKKRWKSIQIYYQAFINDDASGKSFSFDKYKELFSLSYFQESIKVVPSKVFGVADPVPTSDKLNESNTKLLDGSLVYSSEYRTASQNEISNKINDYVQGVIYGLKDFERLSKSGLELFRNLISELQMNGVEIEFFLCPYPPKVFDKVSAQYPNVLKTEEYVTDYAKMHDITVFGSFNPGVFSFDQTYFYDGMHCKEKGIQKIMQKDVSSHN